MDYSVGASLLAITLVTRKQIIANKLAPTQALIVLIHVLNQPQLLRQPNPL